ncbi:MAG: YkoF family thiamine/hydroxymethylpyrimidine-binding protein, partial [Methylophagaceae bacterium]
MRISVDISLYPLNENYVEPILTFIKKLEENSSLIVKRNSLSTQIFGEYRDVMDCLDDEIEAV